MNRPNNRSAIRWLASFVAIAIVMMPLAIFAQTKIAYHPNKYKPTDDVKLGRQAAAEAERQFPLLRDAEVNAYVERVGQRLVAAIPEEFQHPEFRRLRLHRDFDASILLSRIGKKRYQDPLPFG